MTDEWFTDEQLWVESYPTMFPEHGFEAARREIHQILELTGCSGGALLDLACGPGRHAVPFATRKFSVTGVDRSPFLLDKARAYAEAEGAELELVQRDMREFTRPGAFDMALCMFTSFGLFEDAADNQRVLDNVRQSLRPGAPFVVDVMGKEIIARIYQETASTELDDGKLYIQRREVVDDWSRIEMDWLYVEGERVRYSKRLRHWIYSARELRQMLHAAGFSDVVIYGDLSGAPYGPAAKRLIAVGRGT